MPDKNKNKSDIDEFYWEIPGDVPGKHAQDDPYQSASPAPDPDYQILPQPITSQSSKSSTEAAVSSHQTETASDDTPTVDVLSEPAVSDIANDTLAADDFNNASTSDVSNDTSMSDITNDKLTADVFNNASGSEVSNNTSTLDVSSKASVPDSSNEALAADDFNNASTSDVSNDISMSGISKPVSTSDDANRKPFKWSPALLVALLVMGLGGTGYRYLLDNPEKLLEEDSAELKQKTEINIKQSTASSTPVPAPAPIEAIATKQPKIIEMVLGEKNKTTQSKLRVITHVVVRGDTLWDIAETYVKNPFRYPELAELNKIKNPDLIYPDEVVRIHIYEQTPA